MASKGTRCQGEEGHMVDDSMWVSRLPKIGIGFFLPVSFLLAEMTAVVASQDLPVLILNVSTTGCFYWLYSIPSSYSLRRPVVTASRRSALRFP